MSAGAAPAPDIEALIAGDEDAFATLVRAHHAGLVRVAAALVGSAAAAEEVAQETWLAVLDGIAGFEGRSSLKTWIYRILIRRAHDRARREGRDVPLSSVRDADSTGSGAETAVEPSRFRADGAWASPPVGWGVAPDTLVLRSELAAALARAVETLPPAQRAVLVLHDVEGLDTADVCDVLGIGEANARVALHRARAGMRTALEPYLRGGR